MQLQQYWEGNLYIVLHVYIKRKKSPQMNNLTFQFQTPEKKKTKENILNPKQTKQRK